MTNSYGKEKKTNSNAHNEVILALMFVALMGIIICSSWFIPSSSPHGKYTVTHILKYRTKSGEKFGIVDGFPGKVPTYRMDIVFVLNDTIWVNNMRLEINDTIFVLDGNYLLQAKDAGYYEYEIGDGWYVAGRISPFSVFSRVYYGLFRTPYKIFSMDGSI